MTMTKLDFVAIHSPDSERSRRFYADTLGLRADEHAQLELWAGATCLGIWESARDAAPGLSSRFAYASGSTGEPIPTGAPRPR